eukprot:TRINITY_DN248_c0_g1_i1.p1 TRINITY_DN248_c0_g1~~TRINITY_DN248_c0_g1_i1.p1  ORF type:complete len:685 (+),score=74.10 TRINITY_DN248_c0_g1_i1:79-2055(+)
MDKDLQNFTFGRVAHDSESDDAIDEQQEAALRAAAQRRGARHTVSAEPIDVKAVSCEPPRFFLKNRKDEEELEARLLRHEVFRTEDAAELGLLVGAFEGVSYRDGEVVAEPATVVDEGSRCFWLVRQGRVRVEGTGADACLRGKAGVVEAGGDFGVGDLLIRQERTWGAVAEGAVEVWCLTRAAYQNIRVGASVARRKTYEQLLRKVTFLVETLSDAERARLADALQPCRFGPGDQLITYGEAGYWMYFILSGTVRVIGRDEEGRRVDVCEFGAGDVIGELEFVNHHETVADCVAATDVTTARISRPHFDAFMGPLVDYLRRRGAEHHKYTYYNTTAVIHRGASAGQSVAAKVNGVHVDISTAVASVDCSDRTAASASHACAFAGSSQGSLLAENSALREELAALRRRAAMLQNMVSSSLLFSEATASAAGASTAPVQPGAGFSDLSPPSPAVSAGGASLSAMEDDTCTRRCGGGLGSLRPLVPASYVPPGGLTVRSELVAIRDTPSKAGRGIFARAPIAKGAVVAVKAGRVLTGQQILAAGTHTWALQIGPNLYIGAVNADEVPSTTVCINHSCDGNIGFAGNVLYVALRDISPGEELTHDYALAFTDDEPHVVPEFACACATSLCRRRWRRTDYKLASVRAQYDDMAFQEHIRARW